LLSPPSLPPTELPESLKALFRPVSMVLPDLGLICEIMLMAEGFQMSKILSRKFVILYKLCEDLLSKSKHYDWKLRAIKTTLYVAGGMKRSAPELSEDKVGAAAHFRAAPAVPAAHWTCFCCAWQGLISVLQHTGCCITHVL
jgi:hypothetical protein